MFTAFSTALSALNANATAIDTVGHNLANLNTTGFKASTVSFFELVGGGYSSDSVRSGLARPISMRQFQQGALKATGNALDVAIQGDGFLITRSTTNGGQFYTRGGSFKIDKTGFLVTGTGERLQGWGLVNGSLSTGAPFGDISIPLGRLRPAVATSEFALDINLNAAAPAEPVPATFTSSIEVYDSLGQSHLVTVQFTKSTTPNAWDYSVSFPDADVSSPVTPVTGTITFDSSGRLVDPPQGGPFPTLEVTGLTSGAADMTLTWNFYNGAVPRLTQFSQPSAVSAIQQNGATTAQLVRVGIETGGRIMAQYSNGEQSVVAQFAMAAILNPDSMIAIGNNSYILGAQTATPAVGTALTGGRGDAVGSSLESSTVDIAREFTNLIVLQRGYQASARVITTVDEISQETINLKR